jgi:phosphatidylcholine synthase
MRRIVAYGVHLFTAAGAGLGFLALLAATRGEFPAMFGWLAVALVVDGIDGSFARRARVREFAPAFSGDTLDLVVDYVTYVLVPAYALAVSGLLPEALGAAAAVLVCVTSALYFAVATMKTDDWYFQGFPAVWNVVVFYLFLLQPPPMVTLSVVVALSALTFAPIPFVHPFRVRRLRPLTLSLLLVGAALSVVAIAEELRPDGIVIAALSAIGLYFAGLGIFRSRDSNSGERR